ncbi:MAG: ATP-binding cassette domain-containing protein [Clostridia bacterium]|nr:ATP-binding cassette domain-containing protein [Clostridia bacterium]
MALLEVTNVDARYYGSSFELKDVNLTLSKGQRLVICGRENSGKTTLLRVLCGLEEYCGGSILLEGKQLKNLSQKDMDVGFTFDRRVLDNKATAKDAISYPMKLRNAPTQDIESYLESTSSRCNIPMQSQIKDLSDMQVAMLILARLFAAQRRLYIVDDVWKDLSQVEKEAAFDYLTEQIRDKSVIVATDDIVFAKRISTERVVVLTDKQVLPMLSAEEIGKRPLNMQSAIFAGYELHIGELTKIEDCYFASLYGEQYEVAKPIGDIYVGKKVCFAIRRLGGPCKEDEVGDGMVMSFYYDLDNERIITC